MIFNLVWLQARQTRSSIKTKVLLRVMLLDTTAHQDVLIKQALRIASDKPVLSRRAASRYGRRKPLCCYTRWACR